MSDKIISILNNVITKKTRIFTSKNKKISILLSFQRFKNEVLEKDK